MCDLPERGNVKYIPTGPPLSPHRCGILDMKSYYKIGLHAGYTQFLIYFIQKNKANTGLDYSRVILAVDLAKS